MNFKLGIINYQLLIILLLVTSSCATKKTEPVKEETHTEEAPSNIVPLTELQMKTAGIELGIIELKNLKNSVKANGVLKVPNQNKAFVTSVNSGVVRSLHIQPGSFVRKGQVIATIVNPDVAGIQQQLQTINAQITLNEIEFKRQQELVEGNAAPLKNVQRVQTELTTLKATRNSLQKQLSTMGISIASVNKGDIVTSLTIKASISGTISNVMAQIGSEVNPSSPIAEIVNNSQLHLDLFVFEKDLPLLKDKQTIHFTLTNNPGKEYDAQIYSIGTAFANESKTIPIHAEVKGDKTGLIEGMSITALISIGEATVPSVPTEAIVNFQGQDYIFIETKNTKAKDSAEVYFERLPVVKGASDVGYTEVTILEDIPPKTPIVTKGAFFVLAKMINIGEEE